MKICNGILHDIGYCISIYLAKALTICLCCIMQSILSIKAIAFVVDFSVQNSVYINQNNFAASLLSPSLAVSLVLQGLFCMISENMLLNPKAVLHKRSFLHNYLPFQLYVHGSKHVVQRCF
jgi:hypothetical protein